MNKSFFLALFSMLLFLSVSAQQFEFSHDVGAEVGLFHFKNVDGTGKGTVGGGTPGLVYAPRLNFWATNESSFSVNSNLSLTFSVNSDNTGGGSSSIGWGMTNGVDFNYGLGSTIDNNSSVGMFVGIGHGIKSVSYQSEFGEAKAKTSGLYGNLGMRFTRYNVSLYSILNKEINIYGFRITRAIRR